MNSMSRNNTHHATSAEAKTDEHPIVPLAPAMASRTPTPTSDASDEQDYWRDHFHNESYVRKGSTFDAYAAAFRTGYEAYERYPGKRLDEIRSELEQDYSSLRGPNSVAWSDAQKAVYAAWLRIDRRTAKSQGKPQNAERNAFRPVDYVSDKVNTPGPSSSVRMPRSPETFRSPGKTGHRN